MSDTAPVLIEVWRGGMVESRHRGAYAIVDSEGDVIAAQGDIDRPVYARSAIKPLQALPLIETGAADSWTVSTVELAIACASHGDEPHHSEVVSRWLERVGLGVADLECGAHPPSHAPSARALSASNHEPSALHNNCSGKHTAMLATCRLLKEPTQGYIRIDHPSQRRVIGVLSEMCGLDLSDAPRGIDGCGLPQLGIPLKALAFAFARFGSPTGLRTTREAACRRIAAAMRAHPFLIAGSGRFCTRAIEIAGDKALVKTGAEGMYVAALPAQGLGIALKIDDGAARAAESAMATLLIRHARLDTAQVDAFQPWCMPPVLNVAGAVVGKVAPAADF